jgi:cysteine synthase
MGGAAREILEDLHDLKLEAPTYFVGALGNGISTRGIGEVLAEQGTTLIGMEPHESPDVLHVAFPERFAELYPGGHPTTQHEVYGTGPGEGVGTQFPNIGLITPRLTDIRLPRRDQWQAVQRQLTDIEAKHVGNSSAACLWAALDLASDPEVPEGATIVTVFYDASWRYLPIRREQPAPR